MTLWTRSKAAPSKQTCNDALDAEVFDYPGLEPGAVTTFREYPTRANERTPGIENTCTHPGEDSGERLRGLVAGLKKLGVATAKI